MNPRIPQLKKSITELEAELGRAKEELDRIQRTCDHDWDEQFTPKYESSYTIPGDPPGTMGVDWRGPVHVPAKTTPMWTRICRKCDKKETTTSITSEVKEVKHPRW